MKYLLSVFAVFVLSGCDLLGVLPGLMVDFTVDKESYVAGESVTLRLKNNSNTNIGYNLCLAQLEWKTDGSWQLVTDDAICKLPTYNLKPGETATYPKELREDIPIGQYRFRDDVEVRDKQKVITTGVFEIQ